MRIISGNLKGRKLASFKGQYIRPTSDMVREAIFDILIVGWKGKEVLDLFAGTGGLGIEALSRGARRVVFVENHPQALLVLAKNINAEAIVIDERTTRLLLENPYRLHKYLEKKFRSRIQINKENLQELERHFSTIKIIRSVELALVSIDLGFFEEMLILDEKYKVVEAILWALKLNGCAISEIEIKKFVKMYRLGR